MGAGTVRTWHGEAVCGLALTLAGAFFAWGGGRMSLLEDNVPGPGLLPTVAGVLLAALGLFIAAAAIARRDEKPILVFDRDSLLAALLLAAAVAVFEPLGFLPVTFAFLWTSFVLVGRASPWRAAAVAGVATGALWLMFVKALGVGLPAAILGP